MPSTRPRAASTIPGCTCTSSRRLEPRHRERRRWIGGTRPKVAMLREQGVNSHVELSYAMDQAGFDTYDVHMTDLQAGRARLDQFQGFVACGGFSYGDTLGAGEGWARSILFNPELADQFAAFFARGDAFALGVCNGCQMMAALAADDPGRRGVAALHAQPERAVRGAPQPGRGAAVAVDLLRRHGRQPDCRSRWRTAKVTPTSRSAAMRRRCTRRCASSTTPAGRPRPIRSTRTAARRPDRRDHGRRPLHRADAAPGARVPQRPDELDLRAIAASRARGCM